MTRLHALTVKGFKSIKSLENFKLNNLNVLIGINGAGKSNFISIFHLLNNIRRQDFQLYVQKQGGVDSFLHFGRKITDEIVLKFEFDGNSLEHRLLPSNDNRLLWEDETLILPNPRDNLEELNDFRNYIKHNISRWKIYHFHDTSDTARVKGQSAINDNLILKTDGENLSAYLYMLYDKYPTEYQRIVSTIRLVLPFFDNFVIRKNVELVELEWFQKGQQDTPLKAHLLSDGSLRFICLMTLLLQPIDLLPDTLLIDEPELGLHPYAIAILADVIKQIAEEKQIIISTQSVSLVNYFEPNDVVVVNQKEGVSSFERLNNETLAAWLEDYALGELWETNLLGGRP